MQEPGGWFARQVAGSPCLELYLLPPSPPPPFPSGRGLLGFICKGLRPLHPRARAESGTGCTCVAGARRGACPAGRRVGKHWRCPAGGLPGRSPADLAFSFISCPHPPAPLPVGKGESQSLFRRGLRPRHPCTESPTALANAAVQETDGCTPAAPLAGNLFLSVLRQTIGSAPGDARGGAPCIR